MEITTYIPRSGIDGPATQPWKYYGNTRTVAVWIGELAKRPTLLKDIRRAGGLANHFGAEVKIVLVWIAPDMTLRYLNSDGMQKGLEICDIVRPDFTTTPDTWTYWGRILEAEINRQSALQQAKKLLMAGIDGKIIALLPGASAEAVKISARQLRNLNFSAYGVPCGDWIRKDGKVGYYDRKSALAGVKAICADKPLYAFGMSTFREPISLGFINYSVNFSWYLHAKKQKNEIARMASRHNYLWKAHKLKSMLEKQTSLIKFMEEKWVAVQQ